jgi:hypothetical protein
LYDSVPAIETPQIRAATAQMMNLSGVTAASTPVSMLPLIKSTDSGMKFYSFEPHIRRGEDTTPYTV